MAVREIKENTSKKIVKESSNETGFYEVSYKSKSGTNCAILVKANNADEAKKKVKNTKGVEPIGVDTIPPETFNYRSTKKSEPVLKENKKVVKESNSRDYNYYEEVKEDIIQYLEENPVDEYYRDEDGNLDRDKLYDDLWVKDSVTGNGSGSYTFNRYQAEEYLIHNLDLLADAVDEFGSNTDVLRDGAEACDVTIRCYLLGQVLDEVLDELELNEE